MWTEAQRHAELAAQTVPDADARRLLYQARVNVELCDHAAAQLVEAFDVLDFHNFAAAFGSCHMDEGVFGQAIHRAEMTAAKERVLGFLVAHVTAGHRVAQALKNSRGKDRGTDWKELRADIDRFERAYHDVRNFLEHLIDSIARGEVEQGVDCSFSTARILTCKQPSEMLTFDFTSEALTRPRQLYQRVITLLEERKAFKSAAEPGT